MSVFSSMKQLHKAAEGQTTTLGLLFAPAIAGTTIGRPPQANKTVAQTTHE